MGVVAGRSGAPVDPPGLRNYPKTLRMFMWANGLQCIVPSGRAVDTNTEHNPVGSARGN